MSQYLKSLRKEEKTLFDTYSNKRSTKDKREHLEKMVNILKLIEANE